MDHLKALFNEIPFCYIIVFKSFKYKQSNIKLYFYSPIKPYKFVILIVKHNITLTYIHRRAVSWNCSTMCCCGYIQQH